MISPFSRTLKVRTPEGIEFSFLLASPLSRALAMAIDLVLISVLMEFIVTATLIVLVVSIDFALGLRIVVAFVIQVGYGILMEWYYRGQTVGKRVMSLQVIDRNGLPLTFSQVVVRNLMRWVDSLPFFYLVGGIATLANRRFQRLGDIAANTVVVRKPKFLQPDLEKIFEAQFNSLLDYPHIVARVRNTLTPDEASIALQALIRRDELDPDARVELFENIADHIRERITFPDEISHELSNEQFIRNIAEVLYRRS